MFVAAVAYVAAEEEKPAESSKVKRGLLLGDLGGLGGGWGGDHGSHSHSVQTIVKTVGVPVPVVKQVNVPVHVPVDRPYPVKVSTRLRVWALLYFGLWFPGYFLIENCSLFI